ncbi:PREDICTED: uncharacterized protein LOC108376113 isoform X2 [Rhagoletis zephyria]|uniref:uncharacterized protein LOC108376113 isoform X2 n=1 Tax=Rhagoletis zephyria TaxID=28612 RepID=UPI0008112E47|nr:PREDICTED: uncharacterized protein LOC108376113 isoform X2 [Rhagoletis zephyria]
MRSHYSRISAIHIEKRAEICSSADTSTIIYLVCLTDGLKMVHSNEDALNKIPLKSASGLDDEEKNGGEFTSDTAVAEEARREQMRANILKWMKKLTIVLICFIGVALISYVIISLCFSDWSKTSNAQSKNSTAIDNDTSFALPSISNYSLSPDDDSNSSKNGALASNSTSDDSAEGSTIAELTTTTIATAAGSIAIAGFSESAATQPTDALTATVSAEPPTAPISTSATNNMPTTAQKTASSQAKPTRKALVLKDTPPLIKEKFVSKLGVYEQAAVCSDREVCSEIGR